VSELKQCKDCNADQGPFSSLTCTQPKTAGDHFKGFDCWHPIGTAKVYEETEENEAGKCLKCATHYAAVTGKPPICTGNCFRPIGTAHTWDEIEEGLEGVQGQKRASQG
jgi:hypothetical protein